MEPIKIKLKECCLTCGHFDPSGMKGLSVYYVPHMDMQGHNYHVMKPYNMLEHWKNIFLHCARRRVNLCYS